MTKIHLSVGSNINREKHIFAGVRELRELFGTLILSSIFETEAVGFSGENFLNLAIEFDTTMTFADLFSCLRQIEYNHGRPVGGKVYGNRYLDIDILTYGDVIGEIDGVILPRPEITRYAYVLAPLAEIAPHSIHADTSRSYQQLWSAFNKSSQKIWRITFPWTRLEAEAG